MEERPLKKQKLSTWGLVMRLYKTIQKLSPQSGSINEAQEDLDNFLYWANCSLERLLRNTVHVPRATVCVY